MTFIYPKLYIYIKKSDFILIKKVYAQLRGKKGKSHDWMQLFQSLGILGSIPAAWLILTLLVLLVYLVTRCCDRRPRPKKSITALKCSLAILALLCSGAVAVGLYGNDDVHNGLVQLVAAAKNVDGILMGVRNQV